MKPTQSLQRSLRRLALNTKQAGKNYYKGTGSGSMGWHTKFGGYIIDPHKVRTYVVPQNLTKFRLTPFVTKNVEEPEAWARDEDPTNGKLYLTRWRREGGSL